MIREIVRTQSDKLVIDIPKEYVGKELEVLIFSNNEIKKPQEKRENDELLKEFNKLTKKRIKPEVKYYVGMENEVNDNDLF